MDFCPGAGGDVSDKATLKNLSEASSTHGATSPQPKNLNSVSYKLNDTEPLLILNNHSSTVSLFNEQPVSPETENQSAAILPSTAAGSTTPPAHIGSINSTGTITATTTRTVTNVQTIPVLMTSTTTLPPMSTATTTTSAISTAAAAAPHPVTTVKATVTGMTTTITVTITNSIKKLLPSSSAATTQPNASTTGLPSVLATPFSTQPATITVSSTKTPANQDKLDASATRAALTRQLVDSASLLAILLFGLLFFVVTVAVFVIQAYESYRRKDYTQVDYLINGMYTDSGV